MKVVRALPLALLLWTLAAPPAEAIITPFGREVDQAITDVIQWFRNQQGGDGGIGGQATGLAALCFMEKRASADWTAPSVGFIGMEEEDQERVRNAVRYMVNNDQGLRPGGTAYMYQSGNSLMAVSLYLATGGDDDVGAQRLVSEAQAAGVENIKRQQGFQGQNQGGWNYNMPSSDGDLSTTQFAMAGLSAATTLIDDAADTLPASAEFITNAKHQDGGHIYRGGGRYESSHAMTASGIWCYRLAGLTADEERVQSGLAWLQANFDNDCQVNWWNNSFYYYLWAAAKGLEVSVPTGQPGIYADEIGGIRDPEADGYAQEPQGWYYDFAYILVTHQSADGSWPRQSPGGCNGNNNFADAAFSCLVLERSLGGVCLDTDEDGLCEHEDNCSHVFNPEQSDLDEDMVGDQCDNCPTDPNPGQEDGDGDDIGDACDKYTCTETNGGVEICDGIDNDCDERIDEQEGGEVSYCATGRPGVCALGIFICVDGAEACVAVDQRPRIEVCDGLDNDCDGLVDEGVLNACGLCGPEPSEACDGLDNDCDMIPDDGDLCPGDQTCYQGVCAERCQDGACPEPLSCEDGYCVGPCAGVSCPAGEICDGGTGICYDPCEGVECQAGEVCVDGDCGHCQDIGCPPGTICTARGCLDDPCMGVVCEPTQFCRDGICIGSCAFVSCALYQTCVDGVCVDDPCGGVICPEGQVCVDGACADDPCPEVECDPGSVCVSGSCVPDLCEVTRCGENERCEMVCVGASCTSQCIPDWVEPPPGDGGVIPPPDAGPGDTGPGEDTSPDADVQDTGLQELADQQPGPEQPQPPPPPPETEEGTESSCACRAAAGGSTSSLPLLLLSAVLLGLVRRRSRSL